MANEQKVGDPRVYWLRIDLGLFDRAPEECDTLAQLIAKKVILDFKTKGVSFCSDVELKEMFGREYQKFIDEVNKSWCEAFRKQNDEAIEAYRKRMAAKKK